MPSPTDKNSSLRQGHELFVADLKARLAQAKTEGQSPEQMQQLAMALASADAGRRATQVVGQVGAWWSGFKLFLLVCALAVVLAGGLALAVEYRHAAPLCRPTVQNITGLTRV